LAANHAAATVSAAPQLRDFKKEATAFVPAALNKRKKAGGTGGAGSSKVNAAPSLGNGAGDSAADSETAPARPDLLSALKDQFGPAPVSAEIGKGSSSGKTKAEPSKKSDDYEKFMQDMGSLLGIPPK